MANMLLSTDEMIEMFQGKVSNGLQSAIKLLLRGELKLNLCQVNKLSANFLLYTSRHALNVVVCCTT